MQAKKTECRIYRQGYNNQKLFQISEKETAPSYNDLMIVISILFSINLTTKDKECVKNILKKCLLKYPISQAEISLCKMYLRQVKNQEIDLIENTRDKCLNGRIKSLNNRYPEGIDELCDMFLTLDKNFIETEV